MPRNPRVFVEGGIYHVYNRFASGEDVFNDPEVALEFIELLRFVKKRDGWQIFAWTLMSNHFHLAIRSRAVPISQGFHYLQGTFSRRFNRSRKRTGSLWQSRYQAKPIDEQRYLDRVILYIHLNPVAGGLVENPTDHVFGGHREIVKRVKDPVIDADEALLSFGETEKAARRAYLTAIRHGCRELGRELQQEAEAPGIWFRGDRDLAPDDAGPYIDVLGRSTGPERMPLSAAEFINKGARHLEIDVADLASRTRRRHVVEARRLLLTLGRERWGQKAKDLGAALGKKADTISYLAREGIRQRLEEEGFARRYEALDEALIDDAR
jgi:REP-associated tyrosine transposase